MMANDEPALETVLSGKHAMIDFRGQPTAGEHQRVLIGRALMPKPRLLILDEPCAGLDPAAREHFLGFLQRLGRRRNSPTLVLVTHHVEEIMPVFSHALRLRKGEVLAIGEKDNVLTSRLLSQAFETRMQLRTKAGRYQLRLSESCMAIRSWRQARQKISGRAVERQVS